MAAFLVHQVVFIVNHLVVGVNELVEDHRAAAAGRIVARLFVVVLILFLFDGVGSFLTFFRISVVVGLACLVGASGELALLDLLVAQTAQFRQCTVLVTLAQGTCRNARLAAVGVFRLDSLALRGLRGVCSVLLMQF